MSEKFGMRSINLYVLGFFFFIRSLWYIESGKFKSSNKDERERNGLKGEYTKNVNSFFIFFYSDYVFLFLALFLLFIGSPSVFISIFFYMYLELFGKKVISFSVFRLLGCRCLIFGWCGVVGWSGVQVHCRTFVFLVVNRNEDDI